MACFLVPTAEAIVTGVVSKVEKKMKLQWRARSRSPASSSGSKICSGAAQRCWRMSMSGMAKLYPGSRFDGCGKSGGCGSYAARDGDRRRDDGTSGHGCVGLHFARRG